MSSTEEEEGVIKGRWTSAEDAILTEYLKKHGLGDWKSLKKLGEGDWKSVQKMTGLKRTRNSCWWRWNKYLKPGLKKGPITQEEEDRILELHATMGDNYSQIAELIPGRGSHEIRAFLKSPKMQRKLAERSQNQVDVSQAANNPDTTEKSSSMFENGSGSSQFLNVSPNPVMQQCNSLDSTCISNAAAPGPALIDPYTDLSGNTSMKAMLPSQTGGTETQQGSSSSSTFTWSFPSLDKPRSPRDNGYLESIFYPAKVSEGSSSNSLLPCNIELDKQRDLSLSEEDLNLSDAFNPLYEVIRLFTEENKKGKLHYPQGLGSSQFAQGLESSQFPNPDSMFAHGSGSSQFPAVSPSPVMQQQNSLDSTFSNTLAAGPALIDQYTGLSENTFMKAGQTSLTAVTETQQGSSCGGSTLKRSFSSLDKSCSPHDNCYLESMLYPPKVPEGSSDDYFIPFDTDLANRLDLSISQEDFDMAMNPLNEIFEPFNKIQKKEK
ncbi:hypothetical protein RIF29_17764 [Crotalaria pallida]|uniref:Uncharacterized protein n=1 Tax=Crotalaria pallida TaxID=3830 RepID=A0AAN9FJZ0_CROPI